MKSNSRGFSINGLVHTNLAKCSAESDCALLKFQGSLDTMRLTHISLTARSADALSAFYREVFGFVDMCPPKRLSGELVSRGNGLPNSDICSVWLNLPNMTRPFLEIMEYSEAVSRRMPAVNEPGYGHLAFEVPDLSKSIENVLRSGGVLQGEVTNFGTQDRQHLIVYVRDVEGNILELEQPFMPQ